MRRDAAPGAGAPAPQIATDTRRDYADLASPKPLLRNTIRDHIGIILRSA